MSYANTDARNRDMSFANTDDRIRKLYDFALQNGFSEDTFLCADNLDRYVDTALDGYRDYPLFSYVFDGGYDEKTFARMMKVDFKSRLNTTAGLASSLEYESVFMLEPPLAKKTGMLQYVKCADPRSYTLLLEPAMYRQETFERYAREKRKPYLDESTWYMYLFATRKDRQHQGYGKKLMSLALSYIDSENCRACLETNSIDNISLYEHFGFKLVETSVYKNKFEHFVMLYGGD